jgi:hypothetical protein
MAEAVEDEKDKKFIVGLLQQTGPLTTDEIIDAIKEHKAENFSPDCNDRTMRNLISMKKNKVIMGSMNRKKRTWEWSLD